MERTIDFQGKKVTGTVVEFKVVEEPWAVYDLEDGTIIKLKLVAQEILRLSSEHDDLGNPIYVVKSVNVMAPPKSPPHLIKEKKPQS